MAFILCTVTIPRDSALPEDVTVNTFHFTTLSTPPLQTELDAINTALLVQYFSIDGFLGSINAGPATVKMYNMADPSPRQPIFDAPSGAMTFSTTSLPCEVALCLSFEALPVSGINQARRRNRVFFGPLGAAEITTTGGYVRPSAALMTAWALFGENLLNASDAAVDWSWQVYSPTTDATGTLQDAFAPVTNGWVDNSFDTQRRRGGKPTARTLFT